MATGIILAGGRGTRMPGDKSFMEVAGRRVISIQLDELGGLFEEFLIVGNIERMDRLSEFEARGVRVVEETVRGKGPLGGILSGLLLSRTEENFLLACDMPFVKRAAVEFTLRGLDGYEVAVPVMPEGLEPLHAAYSRSCLEAIEARVGRGELKVTGFYDDVKVNYIPWERLERFDQTGRMLFNVNSPEDIRT